MKKIFLLTAIFTLALISCDNFRVEEGGIGDTGPGGGIIFFAEGSQYMECSGELGNTTWDAARTAAMNHRGGGFTNWRLPNRAELDLMYKNLKQNGLGSFSNGWYWTSAGDSYWYAFAQNFNDGTQNSRDKSYSYGVRAVRSYTVEPEPEPDPDPNLTSLRIQNQSSTGITNVRWNNVNFSTDQTLGIIGTGAFAENTVEPGTGFIFFTRQTNPINARTQDIIIIEEDEQKQFIFGDNTPIVDVDNPGNIGTLAALQPVVTSLTIRNESFTEITDVIWQNVSFANNQFENVIRSGTSVTNNVQAGGGFIFFKRGVRPVTARTKDMIIIERGQQISFTFTDDTVIAEVNNPGNDGTLGVLESTVVWFDDAEGEMQPYHLRQSYAGYYDTSGTGLIGSGTNRHFYPPRGSSSIAVGGTATALLHLRINLDKKARLSFWYANRFTGTAGAIFSINNEEKAKWTTNIEWSFTTYDLEPGINDLVWEKKDGISGVSIYYLSLDDILIYYTE